MRLILASMCCVFLALGQEDQGRFHKKGEDDDCVIVVRPLEYYDLDPEVVEVHYSASEDGLLFQVSRGGNAKLKISWRGPDDQLRTSEAGRRHTLRVRGLDSDDDVLVELNRARPVPIKAEASPRNSELSFCTRGTPGPAELLQVFLNERKISLEVTLVD